MQGASDGQIRTPEGVMIRVTSRPPEFFLRIVTPSGLGLGWPVTKGSIGYKVAEEIVALGEPAPKGSERARDEPPTENIERRLRLSSGQGGRAGPYGRAVTGRSSCQRSIRRAMACRREGISPCVFAQPGRPARSGSVMLHGQASGRPAGRSLPDPADDPTLEQGDAIGARLAVREGALPGDARAPSTAILRRRRLVGLSTAPGRAPRGSRRRRSASCGRRRRS